MTAVERTVRQLPDHLVAVFERPARDLGAVGVQNPVVDFIIFRVTPGKEFHPVPRHLQLAVNRIGILNVAGLRKAAEVAGPVGPGGNIGRARHFTERPDAIPEHLRIDKGKVGQDILLGLAVLFLHDNSDGFVVDLIALGIENLILDFISIRKPAAKLHRIPGQRHGAVCFRQRAFGRGRGADGGNSGFPLRQEFPFLIGLRADLVLDPFAGIQMQVVQHKALPVILSPRLRDGDALADRSDAVCFENLILDFIDRGKGIAPRHLVPLQSQHSDPVLRRQIGHEFAVVVEIEGAKLLDRPRVGLSADGDLHLFPRPVKPDGHRDGSVAEIQGFGTAAERRGIGLAVEKERYALLLPVPGNIGLIIKKRISFAALRFVEVDGNSHSSAEADVLVGGFDDRCIAGRIVEHETNVHRPHISQQFAVHAGAAVDYDGIAPLAEVDVAFDGGSAGKLDKVGGVTGGNGCEIGELRDEVVVIYPDCSRHAQIKRLAA